MACWSQRFKYSSPRRRCRYHQFDQSAIDVVSYRLGTGRQTVFGEAFATHGLALSLLSVTKWNGRKCHKWPWTGPWPPIDNPLVSRRPVGKPRTVASGLKPGRSPKRSWCKRFPPVHCRAGGNKVHPVLLGVKVKGRFWGCNWKMTRESHVPEVTERRHVEAHQQCHDGQHEFNEPGQDIDHACGGQIGRENLFKSQSQGEHCQRDLGEGWAKKLGTGAGGR
jgi:hypothetical protein